MLCLSEKVANTSSVDCRRVSEDGAHQKSSFTNLSLLALRSMSVKPKTETADSYPAGYSEYAFASGLA